MTDFEKIKIDELKKNGYSYSQISKELNIPIGTIKTFIMRKRETNTCLNCHCEIVSIEHHKKKKFCSNKCRLEWWSRNRDKLNLKTLVEYECECCHKKFRAPRSAKRKYCSNMCYVKAKVKNNG